MFTGDGHQGNSEIIVIDTNGTPITFNACLDTKLFRLGSHDLGNFNITLCRYHLFIDTRKQGFKAVNALRKYDSEQFKWTSDATDLLINIRLKMNDEFKNSTRKQSDLWEKVSQLMKEIGDFTVLSNICHNKFRNLLITYKANKRKHSMLGNKSIKWEFFDVIDSIFKDEETIYPKKRKRKTLEENVSEGSITFKEIASPLAASGIQTKSRQFNTCIHVICTKWISDRQSLTAVAVAKRKIISSSTSLFGGSSSVVT
ncbi:hypothetical protein NQ317_001060 [Molorchus minor]|uniref:Myb/SANT-like DNA-binding domain-containing protein n=1 Tax=Molorchus minor TaxID=1323400 RepID=A0ABQ9JQK1_9CUCU|nr:hypothetical protein NQ317_001060 [Molorchus minor]